MLSTIKRFTFILICFTAMALQAQVPGKINYQAVIRDASGSPLLNSPVNVRFQLFDQIVAGTQLYQEDFTATTNSFGVVNLALGTAPIFGNLKTLNWGGNTYYVNMQMGNPFTDIASTRSTLLSVPYAFQSAKADTAMYALQAPPTIYTAGTGISVISNQVTNTAPDQTVAVTAGTGVSVTGTYPSFTVTNSAPDQTVSVTAGNGVSVTGTYPAFTVGLSSTVATPVGTISAFGGSTPPAGWLLCDGSSFNTSQYPQLYAVIGFNFGGNGSNFNLPDFRGRFLRGVDGTAGNDPDNSTRTAMAPGGQTGNSVGSIQDDELGAHTHTYARNASGQYPTGNNGAIPTGAASSANTGTTCGAETRPKNAYVHYIIKY